LRTCSVPCKRSKEKHTKEKQNAVCLTKTTLDHQPNQGKQLGSVLYPWPFILIHKF
jgi:hypothetical protein